MIMFTNVKYIIIKFISRQSSQMQAGFAALEKVLYYFKQSISKIP